MQPIQMNVLAVLCDHYWMQQHLVPTLKTTFQNVEVFLYEGMAKWYDPKWIASRKSEMDRLMTTVRALRSQGKLDLIFMIVYDDFLFPEVALAIKKMGIHMINYHVDMPTQWYRCIRTAPYFDLIGVTHQLHMDDLARYGAKLLYVPMAANTDYFRPLDIKKEYNVLFIGSYTPARADVLAAASDVTKSVHVAGSGWQEPTACSHKPRYFNFFWKKYLYDLKYVLPRLRAENIRMLATRNLGNRIYAKGGWNGGAVCMGYQSDIVELINKAKIVLGINQRWGSIGSKNGHVSSRLRDFEAPACGSLYLVQRYPELHLHYIEDEEVVAWSNLDELRRKVDHYLSHEKERQSIAAAGRERVVRTHQWKHRYRAMLAHLNEGSS